MKKIWKRSLTFLLVLAMALALCACGGVKVDGIWTYNFDITEMLSKSLADSMGELSGDVPSVQIPMTLTLNKDMTYTAEIDAASAKEAIDTFVDFCIDQLVEVMYASAAESGLDRDAFDEAMVAQYGMNTRDFCESAMSMVDTNEIIDEMDSMESGTYKVKAGNIYFDNDDPCAFTLEGDSLTIHNLPGLSEELDMDSITFTRVN